MSLRYPPPPAVSRLRRGPAAGERLIAPTLLPAAAERLDAYADRFTAVFARADQLRWFRAYLHGLLAGGPRKNLEAIAAHAPDPAPDDTNRAQAVQHFVSNSPWDANRLLARYRELLPAAHRGGPGTWVVHDAVVPKKGRHSVGTQRQFARSLGRKLNCQIGVTVGRVGPAGYVPLAVRLYLPGYWLREHRAVVEKTVPEGFRQPLAKPDVALQLLDEVLAGGWPRGPVAAEDGYATHPEFTDGLAARLLEPDAAAGTVAAALARFEWLKSALGFEHFEGRTWVGWHHHAALVFAAYGFLVAEGVTERPPPADVPAAAISS